MLELTPRIEGNRLQVEIGDASARIIYDWRGPSLLPPPRNDNFALLAALAPAMRRGGQVRVNGRVDSRLMTNAEKYSEIWASWRPDIFRQVRITAAEELPPATSAPAAGHAFALSAGLDSVFSLMQNRAGADGRVHRQPGLAYLMRWQSNVNAPDPWLDRLSEHAQRIAGHTQTPFYVCTTNWRAFSVNFFLDHALGIIAAAHCLNGLTSGCVIAADAIYMDECKLAPLGNNHTTNPLLSSSGFEVVGYGGAYRRLQKMELVAQSPELLQEIVVCHEKPVSGANCGRCEKCVRSGLELFVHTGAVEPFMQGLPSPWALAAMKPMSESSLVFWRAMLNKWPSRHAALRAGINTLMWRSEFQQQPLMRALKSAEIFFRRRRAAKTGPSSV